MSLLHHISIPKKSTLPIDQMTTEGPSGSRSLLSEYMTPKLDGMIRSP